MRLEIRPGDGIGPVKLGMSRNVVRAALAGQLEDSRADTDYFFENSLQVTYSPKQTAEFIEVSTGFEGIDFIYEGMDVFDTPADKLVRHVKRFDRPDPELSKDGYEYVFPKLILTLWNPEAQHDHKRGKGRPIFGTVGVGNDDYLAAIRRIGERKRPSEIEWPEDKTPSKKHRAAVAALMKADKSTRIGVDGTGEIRSAWLHGPDPVTTEEIGALTTFTKLEHLNLAGLTVSDHLLAQVKRIASLEGLMLCNAKGLTDSGLVHLKALKNLVELGLPSSISSGGMKQLLTLENLTFLTIDLQKGAEQGLKYLKGHPQLRELCVSDHLTARGVRLLGSLSNIEMLDISDCKRIKDSDLVHLKNMKKLQELNLSSRTGNAALKHFEKLTNLKLLVAFSSQITDRGVAKLRKPLPDLEVYL